MNVRLTALGTLLGTLVLGACEDRAPSGNSATVTAALPSTSARLIGPVPGPGDRPPGKPNPLADDARAPGEGRRLFVWFNCSGCHGTHGGGGMGPSLRDAAWIYGSEDADVYDSVASGRAYGMPAYTVLLPPEGIWRLVAYIKALGTSEEPQPPQ